MTAKQQRPVRVLMLIENTSFPNDRRMRHLAEILRDAGYAVSVVCPRGLDRDRSGRDNYQGIQVYRFPILTEASGRFGYVVEYLWSLLCLAWMAVVIVVFRGIDIIHVANPPDTMFLIAAALKVFGIRFVYDQHDLCPELYMSKFGKRGFVYKALLLLENFSYRTADLVIATNESYRETAMERGRVAADRVIIVRNGVDLTRFHREAQKPELKRGRPFLAVYLGVMGTQDGVNRVVEAAYHMVHTLGRTDVSFVLIGTGECWESLRKLSHELGVADYVHLTGFISEELLHSYLSTADVCLAPDPPDRMNQLSTMTKIMEYMAFEQPIVSFDLLETRRSAAEAAIYVSEDNSELFARALASLLDDPERRAHMGAVGLDRTIRVVGLDRSREALLAGYQRFAGTDKSAPVSARAGATPS